MRVTAPTAGALSARVANLVWTAWSRARIARSWPGETDAVDAPTTCPPELAKALPTLTVSAPPRQCDAVSTWRGLMMVPLQLNWPSTNSATTPGDEDTVPPPRMSMCAGLASSARAEPGNRADAASRARPSRIVSRVRMRAPLVGPAGCRRVRRQVRRQVRHLVGVLRHPHRPARQGAWTLTRVVTPAGGP